MTVQIRECNENTLWIYFESSHYHQEWDAETGEQYDSNIEEYTIPKANLRDELDRICEYEGVDELHLDLGFKGKQYEIVA